MISVDRKDCYCKECRKRYNKKYNSQHSKKFWAYVFIASDKKTILYVGITNNIKRRMSNHLNKHTHIKNLVDSDTWIGVKYIELDFIENMNELRFIENCLIDRHEPMWNTQYNIVRVHSDRQAVLKEKLLEYTKSKKWEKYTKNNLYLEPTK